MNRFALIFISIIFCFNNAAAEIALSQFSILGEVKLKISFNGNTINTLPKSNVMVRAGAGLHTVGFQIYDVCGTLVDECYEELFIKSGLNSDYRIVYDDCGISHLELVNESLMYVERLRKPDKFYKAVKIA